MTAAAVVTTLGMVGGASPAFAEGAGASVGSSDIHAQGTISNPLCIQTQNAPTITLRNVGTVGAVNASPVVPGGSGTAASYTGGSVATIHVQQFYFSPLGTYQSPSGSGSPACASLPPGAPQRITVTGWTLNNSNDPILNTAPGVGTASCSGGTGTGSYIRVTNAYKIQVTGTCTVSDGVTTAVSTETFVFSGNENPCLDTFTFTPPPPLPQQQLGPIPDCSTLDPLIPVVLGSTRGTREQPELGGIDGRDGCAHRSARRRNERRGT